jgi:hypothetical protein
MLRQWTRKGVQCTNYVKVSTWLWSYKILTCRTSNKAAREQWMSIFKSLCKLICILVSSIPQNVERKKLRIKETICAKWNTTCDTCVRACACVRVLFRVTASNTNRVDGLLRAEAPRRCWIYSWVFGGVLRTFRRFTMPLSSGSWRNQWRSVETN